MVAKISVGKSLYGALAYNGEKINEAKGRLLTTNRIYNDGTGTVDIRKAMEGFLACMPEHTRVEKPVLHISLNPHPDDVLTDTELQDIAREYLEKLGYGDQPYLIVKHEDIDRHHLHIVTINVDEKGRRLNQDFLFRRSDRIRRELEQKYGLHPAERKNQRIENPLRKVYASAGDVKRQVGNTVKARRKRGETCAGVSITGWSIPSPMMPGTRRATRSSPRFSGSPQAMKPCRRSLPVPSRRLRTGNSPT